MSALSSLTSSRSALEASPEFLLSAELYVPPTASAALRKQTVSRRKAEWREPARPAEESQKKVKEKSSWMSLARSAAGGGQWRPATCKISDEDDKCSLNIYIDETILYQTVYIHMLNHTDIRQADPSLFLRKNCLGIYSVGGQRWSSTNNMDPLYLHFSDAEECNTWLVLLRSYSKPEIYGQAFIPADGGLYRMWRQVELTIVQGRSLGNHKSLSDANASSVNLGDPDARPEHDPVDLDVFCEIHLNDNLCGRTTVKKGIGSPDWHEGFTFADLPPFEALEVVVWKEKRLLKPILLGSVRIALSNFRRSEAIEGWFPVLQPGAMSSCAQAGDIRMKIRVDEEIILPHSGYSGLLQVLHTRNVLDWMGDFERKLQLRTISFQLMCIAIAKNVLLEHVSDFADREVDGTPHSHNTLFRGNTILTKTMELAMAFYGRAFLEASIGSIIRRLCSEKVAIEVDPVRSGKGSKDVERSVEQLVYWSQEIWNQIYAVRNECPHEMRRLFEHVRKLVQQRYGVDDSSEAKNRDLHWQSVSAFCFLRFIVPAILHPHLFGLYPGLPSAGVQRSLTLIAKVIQSLANLNATVQKEDFMRGIGDFLKHNLPKMVEYLLVVSTPELDPYSPHSGLSAHRHDRLNVVNSLHQRGAHMPILDKEAIPLLPHVLDIPRHLACISSAIIRSARTADPKGKSSDNENPHLSDLCAKAFDVEEQGLRRVSQLAGVESSPVALKWDVPRAPATIEEPFPSPPSPISPARSRQRRRVSRPSTAPSLTDLSARFRAQSPSDSSVPPSPITQPVSSLRPPAPGSEPDMPTKKLPPSQEVQVTRTPGRPRFLRPKSISADSISTFATPTTREPHTSSSPSSLNISVVSPIEAFDDSNRKRKNILHGFLTRR
ncbi:Rho GTPase activation protein [Leucogyrophana mollusca]|uniref:Rho GTPase activation protein n=1 Tax=Leucogyrophana mollusca TaxID=85980 RepID=A0ACB8BZB8_9AGAM|nr:Rho GTPase activation protein [Leucogyrophana mollusca]